MTNDEIAALLAELMQLPSETEWVEFKCNNSNPQQIGEYVSALANSTALNDQEAAFLVWGLEDKTHRIVGTTFKPHLAKGKGNEPLETWLLRLLEPKIDLKIHEAQVNGQNVVIFEIPPARDRPVAFSGTEYIRVGSAKKKLKDNPEKERALWVRSERTPFESGIAQRRASSNRVLELLDYPAFFEIMERPLPDSRSGVLQGLEDERLITRCGSDAFHVTNLGAILFAKDLQKFSGLARKAVWMIVYDGVHRVKTLREQEGRRGYAGGFQGLVRYINEQLPHNELIEEAIRKDVPMYPEIAVRELVANMLIHQDFNISGTGPMVEIFDDRIEIMNPGEPLIDVRRFLDLPPRSRNEALATMMRRMRICEERGSGIDIVLFAIEFFQLPAPNFERVGGSTRATLYSPRELARMNRDDRIRACYLHASLRWVSGKPMTNASLRKRLRIADQNYSIASRIIRETTEAELVRRVDPESGSNRNASYLPFWA